MEEATTSTIWEEHLRHGLRGEEYAPGYFDTSTHYLYERTCTARTTDTKQGHYAFLSAFLLHSSISQCDFMLQISTMFVTGRDVEEQFVQNLFVSTGKYYPVKMRQKTREFSRIQ